jgi:CheY-like chemotaxis protein
MSAIPRIITVDPTWTISRIVRSAIDLTERAIIQVDVPGTEEAIAELGRGAQLLVTSLMIGDGSDGIELARRARQSSSHLPIVVLADFDAPMGQDKALLSETAFLYLRRPVDAQSFMRVLIAALDGRNIVSAFDPVTTSAASALPIADLGPVPALDVKAAQVIVDKLLMDVGARTIVLSNRVGEVMLERGSAGYLDRDALTRALLPTVTSTVSMGGLVGGQSSALSFYDGDTFDVFVLSVGYHHFLSLIYDGASGVRQFGAVTRFGRRGAEDLKALLGASAYTLQAPSPEPVRRKTTGPLPASLPEEEPLPLAKADNWVSELEPELLPEPEETETLRLDPLGDLDLSIFDQLPDLDTNDADALFSPDEMAKLASESRRGRGPISYDEARNLGIVP